MRIGQWNSLAAYLVVFSVIGALRVILAIETGAAGVQQELQSAFWSASVPRAGTPVPMAAVHASALHVQRGPRSDESWMQNALQDIAFQQRDRDPATWLLVGSDSRKGEVARSDTLMLVRLSVQRGTALLCSIPRDTRLYICDHGYTKVNHALVYGDLPLLKATVQRAFGIPVDHIVSVDFQGFSELVDALGGVVVELRRDFDYDDASDGTHIHLKAGRQRLTGKTALDFVRFRHDVFADTGRMERQQQFLKAVAATPLPFSRWWRVGNAAMRLQTHIHSDLSEWDLLAAVARIALIPHFSLHMRTLHGINRVDPRDGLWYFYVDARDVVRLRGDFRRIGG